MVHVSCWAIFTPDNQEIRILSSIYERIQCLLFIIFYIYYWQMFGNNPEYELTAIILAVYTANYYTHYYIQLL